MDRWSGVLKVPLRGNSRDCYNVAASLCLSATSKSLAIPGANAIFFSGDRVSGTGNPVIERLSSLQNIAEILVSKLGGGFVNAYVIEASLFNGPFAVYKDFIPSVNRWGDPQSYDPSGFPASESIVVLLSNCLQKVNDALERAKGSTLAGISEPKSCQDTPETLLFGFSKGGTVLNQLLTELGFSDRMDPHCDHQITPATKQNLLSSIREIHYVDVGLNSAGAYVTDEGTIERIPIQQLRLMLHGTPRQWCDGRRPWIRQEKDVMLSLLRSRAMMMSEGKSLLRVSERLYFTAGDAPLDMQMHFEIIEKLDLS